MVLTAKRAEKASTQILPTRTSFLRRFSGFTLIELLIVLFITGVVSSVFLPRISFNMSLETPVMILQRAIEEASNLALSGTPVRFKIDYLGGSGGKIQVEALMKRDIPEDSLSGFLASETAETSVLEWRKVKLKTDLEGENWKFEPSVIKFFNDGSCTPAKITWSSPSARPEKYILTVTGYCAKLEDRNN